MTVDSIPVSAVLLRTSGGLIADTADKLDTGRIQRRVSVDYFIRERHPKTRRSVIFKVRLIWRLSEVCLTRQTFGTNAVDIRVQSFSWVPSESLLFCLIPRKWNFENESKFWIICDFFWCWEPSPLLNILIDFKAPDAHSRDESLEIIAEAINSCGEHSYTWLLLCYSITVLRFLLSHLRRNSTHTISL